MEYESGLESLLRDIVNAAALRTMLENSQVKRMDRIAKGCDTEPFRLLNQLEGDIRQIIHTQCGEEWLKRLSDQWRSYKLLVTLGISDMPYASSEARNFQSNYLAGALRNLYNDERGAPDIDDWLHQPFKAWLEFVSVKYSCKLSETKSQIYRLGSPSVRTVDRWIKGDNIQPKHEHRKIVHFAMGLSDDPKDPNDIAMADYLTGWLLLTIGIQSIPEVTRQKLREYSPFLSRPPEAKKSHLACSFVAEVTVPYLEGELRGMELEEKLHTWRPKAVNDTEISGQWCRLVARLLAERGEDATEYYKQAILDSALNGLQSEEHRWCLIEALAYCRSAKKTTSFKHFWDRARKSALFNYEMSGMPSREDEARISEAVKGYPLSVPLARIYYSDSVF